MILPDALVTGLREREQLLSTARPVEEPSKKTGGGPPPGPPRIPPPPIPPPPRAEAGAVATTLMNTIPAMKPAARALWKMIMICLRVICLFRSSQAEATISQIIALWIQWQ